MPIYEYECDRCGHRFEQVMKISESAPACPACGLQETRKRVVPFRTNGWVEIPRPGWKNGSAGEIQIGKSGEPIIPANDGIQNWF